VRDGYRLAVIGGFAREDGNETRVADLGLRLSGFAMKTSPTRKFAAF
jgi:hypothetical protein